MNLDEAVQGLVSAQAEIDAWDHDFTPAPYDLHVTATEALATVPEAQRAGVVAMLSSPNAAVRREAANACAFWRLGAAHAALAAGLQDTDKEVRDAMATALVAVARETALGTVADSGARLSKWVMHSVIEAAMEAMGTGVLPLVDRVNYAPDSTIGDRDVWWKLYALDPSASGVVLERRVATGVFDWVYGTAALLRAHGGGAWVRPAFLKLLEHTDSSISRVAAEVLKQFGDQRSIEPLLATVRSATHPWQRWAAMKGVLDLGLKTRTPVLVELRPFLANDEYTQESFLRALAGFAGATWEPPALLETLVRAGLRHASEQVVASAVKAAAALRLESLAVEVTATLAHPSWYGTDLVAAHDAYFAFAVEASVAAQAKALERGLGSTDGREVELAKNAMNRLSRAPSARAHVGLMRRALDSSDEALRRTAASALATFEVHDAAEALLARARAGSPAEASSMIDALTKLGDARVVEVALSRAADVFAGAPIPNKPEPAWLCASAVRALGGFLSDPRAFDALKRSLTHVEMRMRRDAATVFGKAGDQRAVPLLQPLLQDKEKQVQGAAKSALEALAKAGSRPGR